MVKITNTSWWGDSLKDIEDAANMFNTCPLWTIEYWSRQEGYGNEFCMFVLYLLHS
jgi:hypothetical protein